MDGCEEELCEHADGIAVGQAEYISPGLDVFPKVLGAMDGNHLDMRKRVAETACDIGWAPTQGITLADWTRGWELVLRRVSVHIAWQSLSDSVSDVGIFWRG